MKKLVTILGLLTISFAAHAGEGTGILGCEVRTAKDATPVIRKDVKILDMVSTSKSVADLGTVNGSSIKLSSADYYGGKAILSLTMTSSKGVTVESLGAAE